MEFFPEEGYETPVSNFRRSRPPKRLRSFNFYDRRDQEDAQEAALKATRIEEEDEPGYVRPQEPIIEASQFQRDESEEDYDTPSVVIEDTLEPISIVLPNMILYIG